MGSVKHVLIDAGKTFYESSLQWFPLYGIDKIDAVVLTHGHADAMLGLDDLRPWTKDAPIPVYLSQETLSVVRHAFPYLVDVSAATGGGAVASLKFRTVDGPFDLFGLTFTPLLVEHGKHMDGKPYHAFGYRVQDIAYISDTNKIPKATRQLLMGLDVFILDALQWDPHASHFSVHQAVREISLVGAKRGYLVGFNHRLEHDDVNAKLSEMNNDRITMEVAHDGMQLVPPHWGQVVVEAKTWVDGGIKLFKTLTR
jgi:phosphoribosyl 1,2-cyclic phosphodiesterase